MPKAVDYILQHFDQIPNMDELLQMSIIEVIKLDCKRDTIHRVCYPYPSGYTCPDLHANSRDSSF